ncbi:MAG: 30S ribosomal protein S12 methylthiotransferase RimO [Candidatus Ratteibacteria bacterium]
MRIAFISLGCPKNLYDTEQLIAIAGEEGFIITDSIHHADLVIINTCGFIKDAVKESEENIKMVLKENKEIIIWGCLVQREKEKLLKKYKNVKGIVGVGNPIEVLKVIKENKKGIVKIKDGCFERNELPRFITTFPYAYIKISDGCINNCNYCLIPKLRGPLRSRKMANILKEAKNIERMGFREIILIAQDTTNYGIDLKDGSNIIKLLNELEKFDFEWIRLMYIHPGHINDELIEKIGESKKICKYFDIPLQHVSEKILKNMNRPIIDYKKLIEKIRKKIPDVAIRTNFIIGFPGETEKEFNELVKFIEECRIDRIGFFKYSREKGTKAYFLPEQVNEREKEERLEFIIKKQEEISRKNLKKYVGKRLKVIIEREEKDFFTGRTEYDAPEIDGIVYIKRKNLKIGSFYNILITSSNTHFLISEDGPQF